MTENTFVVTEKGMEGICSSVTLKANKFDIPRIILLPTFARERKGYVAGMAHLLCSLKGVEYR